MEKLHNLFFRSPFSREVSLDTITVELGLTVQEAVILLTDLIHHQVIEWQPFYCDNCGKEVIEPQPLCSVCGNNVTRQWAFHVDGCIIEKSQEEYKNYSVNIAEAGRFAIKLGKQGYMYYLLLDLAESENIQKQDSIKFNEFLETIRYLIQQEALSQAKDSVLCLGEIGDCLKIAFLSADDYMVVLEKFSETIRKESLDKRFPSLKPKEAYFFPRYDGIIGKIPIASRYRDNLKNIFCVTLSGALDFNDYELTKLFRFDNAIKTRKELFKSGNTILSVWTQEIIFKDISWSEMPTLSINATSHGEKKTDKFGLLVFTGLVDKPCIAVENPQKYKQD